MQNIYLVGFMGTGKTAIGKELAIALGLCFVDIDDLIVGREKRSINDIFSQAGETYFRKVEKEALKEISAVAGQVISCGGGIVIDPQNIAVMKETGKLICLSASPEVILERVKKGSHRPILNVNDQRSKIAELLKGRRPYYERADFVIDTSSLNVKEVVGSILELIK